MAEAQAAKIFLDHVSQQIQQYSNLKNAFTDFVLDAEGALATALEAFSAEQLSRWAKPSLSGLNRSDLAIDMFLCEGQASGKSAIDWFIQASTDLPEETQTYLQQWQDSFQGLFVIDSVSDTEVSDTEVSGTDEAEGPRSYRLTNWLTQKHYSVWPNPAQASETISRMKPGEIVLARLSPLGEDQATPTKQAMQVTMGPRAWTFSGPLTLLGKLGKPKLAVAIGNFKQWFPQHLYGDAPELKEAAWASVQQHYDEFIQFFGAEKITLSGYELGKKLQTYQAQVTEKQLTAAGIDSSKSLTDIAKDAGLADDEVAEAIETLGEDSKIAKTLVESKRSLKMVMPKVTLPDELRKAEAVTVLVHPQWGQAFLSDYQRLETLLTQITAGEADGTPADKAIAQTSRFAALDHLILNYLENERATTYVWQQLIQTHGAGIEASLQRILNRPNFILKQDLEPLLSQYGKPLTPELPETASVPIHLHTLFQDALQAVSKDGGQKKKKKKASRKSGFGA